MAEPVKSNPILPDVIRDTILQSGLVILGSKSCGKTNAGKLIASEIIRNPQTIPIQVKFFDLAGNLKFNFDPILYQTIDDKSRYFYDGDENILFDINLIDEDDIFGFMEKVLLTDYYRQRERKETLNGHVDKWILYFIEESQGVLSSYSLMRKTGGKVFQLFSIGRNFGQNFVLISQRLADLSTRAVERCNSYLIGKTSGDNDISKLKRLIGKKSSIVDEVKKLNVQNGEFIFYNPTIENQDVKFPLYDSHGQKPRPFIPENMPIWRTRKE